LNIASSKGGKKEKMKRKYYRYLAADLKILDYRFSFNKKRIRSVVKPISKEIYCCL